MCFRTVAANRCAEVKNFLKEDFHFKQVLTGTLHNLQKIIPVKITRPNSLHQGMPEFGLLWLTRTPVARRGNRVTRKRPGSVLAGLVRGKEEKDDNDAATYISATR
jgi:hypothetical protein